MKKRSSLAILSFVCGVVGVWGTLTGAPWLAVLGVPLGVGAIGMGCVALWWIRRAPTRLRGRGWAIWAISFGVLTSLGSFALLIGVFFQQFSPDRAQRQNWEQHRHGPEIQVQNRMADESASDFTSNLAIAILDTAGQFITKETPTVVRAQFFEVEQGRAAVSARPTYDGQATIHLRGNSTLHLPKSSYTLHTVDQDTNQIKVSLLGLPAEADWVLYAPYEDKTLMRDVLAYDLARRMGHYAPRTRYLELFVRDSDHPLSMHDYAGVYVLVEKIKRGKERVNLAKLDPKDRSEPEITGGYIIKRDHNERYESRFRTQHGGPYSYVYPKAAEITAEQKRWLTRYLNAFESALYGNDFADPQTGYAAYLDVNSFIDAHWLIEMGKNVDGFRYSAFLCKDRNGKLKPEPPWDWNRAFGNANYYGGGQPHGWYYPNLRPNEMSWYHRLKDDPEFMRHCTTRWLELRQDAFDPKQIQRRIDELAAQLEEAQQRNFQRWPILGRHVTCNYYVGDSYQAEVRWLKKWVGQRIAWIDSQVKAPQN